MPDRKSKKHPRDTNLLAKSIVDEATSEDAPEEEIDPIKAAARELGRRGGLKGGKARAKTLSRERRKEIARKAAQARWDNRKD